MMTRTMLHMMTTLYVITTYLISWSSCQFKASGMGNVAVRHQSSAPPLPKVRILVNTWENSNNLVHTRVKSYIC
jgi:hypothetical protein